MADTIVHRGPDDVGCWSDANQYIGLAHRRLSVVDLSPAGHQPMESAQSRFVIAFNGEIYNHLEIRSQLEKESLQSAVCSPPGESLLPAGNSPSRQSEVSSDQSSITSSQSPYNWRGHSDTETLLAGLEAWGIQATIERAIGMFAVAVWDRETNTLTLARDRVGEKPLYYGWQGDTFLFGSELKALRAHPAFQAEVDRDALCLLLRHNYIPTPYSIYKGIAKLTPGCLLTVSLQQREPELVQYWSGVQVAESGVANAFTGSADEAVNELELLLKDAVHQQMMADVPLGAFLSGGVDSSVIVALMQAQSVKPVKTFAIGFEEKGYNEAVYAKAVAQHLGTDHTELYVTHEHAMEVIPHLPALYDEPFSDSSSIPTFLVSQLAREHVTVSLSGDAGDELFCGYDRYRMTSKWGSRLEMIPGPLRKLMARGITSISPQVWDNLAEKMPGYIRSAHIGNKLHKGAMLMNGSEDEIYHALVSHWDDPASVVIGGDEPATLLTGNAPELHGLNLIQRMMALDMLTYLPDDILVKVDRAAMGVSLESRMPFLDHRLVEFAWRLPQSMKLRDGQTKWALRQVLYRHVPKELIERPKMGFGIPLGDWLRGPLRDWAESLLDEARLQREGFFHQAPIREKWDEHLTGQRDWSGHLWDVLMFQAWLEENQ
nr:asparagine synthase (glutamine-hydrolyzing) [Mariprofundus sp. NF]